MIEPAVAANWQLLHQNNYASIYIDRDSIENAHLTDGTPVTGAWTQMKFNAEQTAYDDQTAYWAMRVFYYFDCPQRKWEMKSLAYHDEQDLEILSVDLSSFNGDSSTDWLQGAPVETQLHAVCTDGN